MDLSSCQEFPQQARANFMLPGPAGLLQISTTWPRSGVASRVVLICHPDPSQQGTMDNKVVTTLAKAFDTLGLATVRFNFRGIGKSEGVNEGVSGATPDAVCVVDWIKKSLPNVSLWLAGFSFGSYIAAVCADQRDCEKLLSIAPPVHHYDYQALKQIQCPWLVVQGSGDEVVPVDAVRAFVNTPPVPIQYHEMPAVSHFFHGQLIALRDYLVSYYR